MFDLLKDFKSTKHKVWQVSIVIFFTRSYKHYTFNTNIVKIIYGIYMDMDLNMASSKGQSFCKKGLHHIYNIIPKSKEWLTINCVVNATKSSLLRFYIFRGEKLKDDYIKHYRTRTCMAMQRKTWLTLFLFIEFYHFSKGQF